MPLDESKLTQGLAILRIPRVLRWSRLPSSRKSDIDKCF